MRIAATYILGAPLAPLKAMFDYARYKTSFIGCGSSEAEKQIKSEWIHPVETIFKIDV